MSGAIKEKIPPAGHFTGSGQREKVRTTIQSFETRLKHHFLGKVIVNPQSELAFSVHFYTPGVRWSDLYE